MTAKGPISLWGHCERFLGAFRAMAGFAIQRLNFARGIYERWVPVTLPESVNSVLFVCKGNICRSPLAEVYFQSLVMKGGRQMVVRSAGLETTPGKPAHHNAKAVALQNGLSLQTHATTQVHADLLERFDLIVVMEIRQKDRILRLYPRARGKTVLLGYFDQQSPLEIEDPYSGPIEEFHACFQQMKQCCDLVGAQLGLR